MVPRSLTRESSPARARTVSHPRTRTARSQSAQWQTVLLVFLKALSLRRAPFLQPAFETREGIGRFNQALATRRFTVEEFYAVLELLVPPSER